MRLSFLASKRKTLMIDMGSVALSTARTMKLAGWPAVRRTPAFGPSMMSFVLALPIPKMTALALARVRIWTDCFSSLATVPSGRTVTISPMNSGSGVVSGIVWACVAPASRSSAAPRRVLSCIEFGLNGLRRTNLGQITPPLQILRAENGRRGSLFSSADEKSDRRAGTR